jgi:hypothetical protein
MSSLTDALRRSLEYIAWANYADPGVWAAWLGAMALLGVVVWVAWSAGRLVMGDWRPESAAEEMVLAVGSGLALASAALFLLGILDLYRWPFVAALAAAAVASPAIAARDPRVMLRPIARLRDVAREAPLVVGSLLVLSIGALLPPHRWDETSYHLAYAEQWVRAGGLTVDPLMRYPLYTFNWQVLQGVALMMRSESAVHLLAWLGGLLGALTVLRVARRLGAAPAVASIAALAFVLTPVVQRYSVLGMADVPLMAFLAAPVLALLAAAERDRAEPITALPAALTAAMFVGMKVTGILFAPLFLALGVLRFRGAARTAFVAVLVAVGGLWYARNLVLVGDPAPPLLSQALGRPATWWSESDLALQAADLAKGLEHDAVSLLSLPARMLGSTVEGPLRDWPALGYVLVFPLSLLLVPMLWRRRQLEPLVVAWYAVAVWIGTAYLIRYAVFLPLAAALAAVVVDRAAARAGRRASLVAATAAVVVLVGPTPAAISYAKTSLSQRIPVGTEERWADVERRMPEAAAVPAVSAAVPAPSRLYTLDAQLRYYYQRAGYEAVGDDFHDGRFRDFLKAAEERRVDEFLHALGVDYLVVGAPQMERRIGIDADSLRTLLALSPMIVPVEQSDTHAIYSPARLAAEESVP